MCMFAHRRPSGDVARESRLRVEVGGCVVLAGRVVLILYGSRARSRPSGGVVKRVAEARGTYRVRRGAGLSFPPLTDRVMGCGFEGASGGWADVRPHPRDCRPL